MGLQLRGKPDDTGRGDEVILRGVVSIPASKVSSDDLAALTASPRRSESAPGKAKTFPVFKMEGDRVLIPRYTYFSRFYSEGDRLLSQEPSPAEKGKHFVGELYPSQMKGAIELLSMLGKKRGATGKGRCGTGKTVIGTYLLARIPAKRSAVLVEQTQIAEQWTQEIRTHIPSAKITYIMPMASQRKICKKFGMDVEGRTDVDLRGDIVIVMAQTLARHAPKNPIQVTLLIVDEAHCFSAPTFAQSIFSFSFRYSLALTATDERPDGLSWIFKAILGPTVVALSGKRMDPTVVPIRVDLGQVIKMHEHKYFWCRGLMKSKTIWSCRDCKANATCADMVTQWNSKKKDRKIAYSEIWTRLSNDPVLNKWVVYVIRKLYEHGRNVMVLSKFKNHLRYLRAKTIKAGVPAEDTSFYWGGMDKDKSVHHRITFATFGISYKALNVPNKDAEVLAMPVSEVEQPVGRIERDVKGKKTPIIVDFYVTTNPFLFAQFKKRMRYYEAVKYGINPSLTKALNNGGGLKVPCRRETKT